MNGVGFTGLMKTHPMQITRMTIETLVITIRLLTQADSCVPRTSSAESTTRITTAGTFIMPWTAGSFTMCSNGECDQAHGTLRPTYSSTLLKYSLHAMATVAAPTA